MPKSPALLGLKHEHFPCYDGRDGGGVGILHRNSVKIVVKKRQSSACSDTEQFEFMECVISQTNDPRSNLTVFVVYRPPPTPINKLKLSKFWRDWKKLLTCLD